MADENFTEFTAGSITGTSVLVGYDTSANTEYRYPSSTLTVFTNANLPIATSSVAGITQAGTGLTMTGSVMSANVVSVAGRTGAVTISVTDVSGAAQSGANTNITSLTGLTARPTWNLSGTTTTPWDSGNLPVIGGRLLSFSVITSSSAVSVPANTAFIIGEAVGPGGGGGGCAGAGAGQISVGQSGGAGTYCKFQITSPPSSINIIIGAQGTGGAASSIGVGGNAGSTLIYSGGTTYASVPGGNGGSAGTVISTSTFLLGPPTQSTAATGSATFIENVIGGVPQVITVGTSTGPYSAQGGSSKWGQGPLGTTGAGVNASQYGAGGSAGIAASSAAAATGGQGGPSKVILWFYANQ